MPEQYDRTAARRFGRRLSAYFHGLAGAAITVVVLGIFADVSLWWLAPVALLTLIGLFGSGLVAAHFLDKGRP